MDSPQTMSGYGEPQREGVSAPGVGPAAEVSLRRARRGGLALITVAGAVVVGGTLGVLTFHQTAAEYELRCRITCEAADPAREIDWAALLRGLRSPPRDAEARGWPCGELLARHELTMRTEPQERAIHVCCRTVDPAASRALMLSWLDERAPRVVAPSEVERELDGLVTELAAYRPTGESALAAQAEALGDLRWLQRELSVVGEEIVLLARERETLGAQAAPKGTITAQERERALALNAAVGEDQRQIRYRMRQLLNLYREHMGPARAVLASVVGGEEALAEQLSPAGEEQQGPAEETIAAVRAFLEGYAASRREWAEALRGLSEGLEQADVDEAQVLIDIVERTQTLARSWMDRSSEALREAEGQVEGMLESQEPSARRVVVQNRLKVGLLTLRRMHDAAQRAVGLLRGDVDFRVDALLKTVRGLHVRTQMRMREIEEELQAAADERARQARAAQLAALDARVGARRAAQQELLGRFLAAFERLQEVSGAATDEQLARQRAELAAEITARLSGIGRNPLQGIQLVRGEVRLHDRPVNERERLRQAGMVGGGGAAIFVLIVGIAAGVRRLFER